MIESWNIWRVEPPPNPAWRVEMQKLGGNPDMITANIICRDGWVIQWVILIEGNKPDSARLYIEHRQVAGGLYGSKEYAECVAYEMMIQVQDFLGGLASGRLLGAGADRELIRSLTGLLSGCVVPDRVRDLVRRFLAFCAAEEVKRDVSGTNSG